MHDPGAQVRKWKRWTAEDNRVTILSFGRTILSGLSQIEKEGEKCLQIQDCSVNFADILPILIPQHFGIHCNLRQKFWNKHWTIRSEKHSIRMLCCQYGDES
jgi:hypothetical protein